MSSATASANFKPPPDQASPTFAHISLLASVVVYRKSSGERKEGFRFGRKAPSDPMQWDRLKGRLGPALGRLLPLARRIAAMHAREETLTGREAALTREAALVASEQRLLMGQLPDPVLAGIAARPVAVGYLLSSDPYAWAISSEHARNTRTVDAFLGAMSTETLRRHFVATRDAVRLTEDEPAIEADLRRALDALSKEARQRGYHPERDEYIARSRAEQLPDGRGRRMRNAQRHIETRYVGRGR